MKLGIRRKLLGGFIMIILMLTGTCLAGLSVLLIVVNSMKHTLSHPVVVNRAAQDIEVLVLSMQRDMLGITLSDNNEDMKMMSDEIREKERHAEALFMVVQHQIPGNEGKMLLLRGRTMFYRWRGIMNRSYSFASAGEHNLAQEITLREGEPCVKNMQGNLDSISDYASTKAKESLEESVVLANNSLLTVSGIILVTIIISLFISFHLSSSLTLRLKSISIATSRMAKGDLKQSLEIKGHDELTQVAGNFNLMASELFSIYENLERMALDRTQKLNEAIEELNRVRSDLEGQVNERTKDLEEKINELNRSQLAMLYMIEDINETSRKLKATQAELIRKERLAILGQFSGNISHELRNPLGVIDSSIYYLRMRMDQKDEKIRQHLERIGDSVRTATSIIENLLNLTRMNKPVLLRYNLQNLVDECIKTMVMPDNVVVLKQFHEGELVVKAEKEQIRMVVDNLVTNAIASMNSRGTLSILIKQVSDSEAEISFQDTGSGIEPQHLTQVFLPLFSTKAKGIGLGLSITKMIVENHKGTIFVDTETGEGARFVIRLPLVIEETVPEFNESFVT